jgi:hypothetical protein
MRRVWRSFQRRRGEVLHPPIAYRGGDAVLGDAALRAAISNSKAQPPKTLDTQFEIGRVLVRHDMPAVFDRIVGIDL